MYEIYTRGTIDVTDLEQEPRPERMNRNCTCEYSVGGPAGHVGVRDEEVPVTERPEAQVRPVRTVDTFAKVTVTSYFGHVYHNQ